jgi:hypothetical protein
MATTAWSRPVYRDVDEGSEMGILQVDCDQCGARGPTCRDCVVTVLLGEDRPELELDGDQQAALSALAESGLVPRLRLVPGARRVRPVQPPFEWQDYA